MGPQVMMANPARLRASDQEATAPGAWARPVTCPTVEGAPPVWRATCSNSVRIHQGQTALTCTCRPRSSHLRPLAKLLTKALLAAYALRPGRGWKEAHELTSSTWAPRAR